MTCLKIGAQFQWITMDYHPFSMKVAIWGYMMVYISIFHFKKYHHQKATHNPSFKRKLLMERHTAAAGPS